MDYLELDFGAPMCTVDDRANCRGGMSAGWSTTLVEQQRQFITAFCAVHR